MFGKCDSGHRRRPAPPVARLLPIEPGKRVLTPEQKAARQRALERMRNGWDLGGYKFKRDELDERWGGPSTRTSSSPPSTAQRVARHQVAIEIVDRSTERPCILTVQALAEFVFAVTRRGMVVRLAVRPLLGA